MARGAVKDLRARAMSLRRAGATYREIGALLGISASRAYSLCDEAEACQKKSLSKPRRCLCCGAEFMSAGPGNRLCSRCRSKDDYMLFAA